MITKKWLAAALALIMVATMISLPRNTAYAASTVTNPGFGTSASTAMAGWSTTGVAAADYGESGGITGWRLSHWSASAYIVTTYQTLTGLANGAYTLSVWTKTGGGQNASYIGLTCGAAAEQRTNLPVSPDTWVQISVSATSTNGSCTISMYSNANAGNWASFDDVTFTAGIPTPTATSVPTATPVGWVTVTNPDFGTTATPTPTGWSTSGTAEADYTETGGRTGMRLTHYSATAYAVSTYQTVTGLANGPYTLRVWTKSAGGQNAAFIGLTCGSAAEQRTNLPVNSTEWIRIAVSAQSTNGQCTISLYSDANAGNFAAFDDVTLIAGGSTLPVLGGDLSGLKKNEVFGAQYLDAAGNPADAITVLKDHGMNYARLKVWVDPADGYNNKPRVLEMATRIKAAGLKLLVDFHYSDFWTDPGQQATPSAWAGYNITQLQTALYNHTYDVVGSLVAQGTPPDMVQVGNELNSGMMWELGRNNTTAGWNNLALLLKQGYNAVKAASPSTLVMLHLANGGTNSLYRTWFDNALSRGVQWDVTGASYYSYWHGTMAALQTNLNDIAARYGKPVIVVETSYPFTLNDKDNWEQVINLESELTTGYPATPAGQAANFRDVMSIVRAVPNGMGLGVFYWEPAWTAVTGNGWDPTDPTSGNAWENQALFDFSNNPLPAMNDYLDATTFIASSSALVVTAASGTYSSTTSLTATLTSGSTNLSGKTVIFSLNGKPVGSATTNASGVATLASASLAGINVGSYPTGLVVSFAGDGTYSSSNNSAGLTVTKADQTITFPAIADKTYGDADSELSATASSGLTVSFTASGDCTVSGTTLHLTGAGSCTVTALQGGDGNFNAAPNVVRTFNIGAASTSTATNTATATPIDTATNTAEPTDTATATSTATNTAEPTDTAIVTSTATNTAQPIDTATAIASATDTASPTNTGTATVTSLPTQAPIPMQPVSWIDQMGVIASGNTITRTSNTNAWDSGAAASQQIISGDGYAQMTVADSTSYVMFGLSNDHNSNDYAEIDYAIYTYANTGQLAIYENGTYRSGYSGYAAGDILKVTYSAGAIRYYKNSTLLYSSNVAPTLPLMLVVSIFTTGGAIQNAIIGGVNLGPVVAWTPTASPTATNTPVPLSASPISWIDLVNSSATGSTLAKSGANAAWDASGAASQKILSGDGYAQAAINDTSSYLMFGLASGHSGSSYSEINYAIYTYANLGELAVYENGVYKAGFSGYNAGDIIKVAVEGGAVKYARNGVVFYTSAAAPSYPLLAVADIFTPGAQVNNAIIAGNNLGAVTPWTPTPSSTATNTPVAQSCNNVTFANLMNVNASGNTITKSSGSSTWNAGATSSQSITSGYGSVSETVTDAVSYTMFGLGTGNNNGSYSAINYAIYTYASTGQLAVYESGAYRGNAVSYTVGDVLKVAVESGVVKYSKNGVVFYSSAVAPSYPLMLNTAIFTPGGVVSNAQLCGIDVTAASQAAAVGANVPAEQMPTLPATAGKAPAAPALPANLSGSASIASVPAQPVVPSANVPARPEVPGSSVTFSDVAADFWAKQYIDWAASHLSLSGYDSANGREFRPDASATRGQVVKLLVSATGWSLVSGPQHFSDVAPSSPFYAWIETAVAHNVISGYADGTFRPGAQLTRAQMVKLVVGAAGWEQAPAGGSVFSDVPASNWAAGYIATAVARGVVSGYADGTFRPEAALTRAQMVKLLFNGFAR